MPDLTPDVERELSALDDALAGRRVAPDLAKLGELALALRAERAAPSPGFGRALDEQLARGFRDPGPRRRAASGRRWWSALTTAPVLGTAAALLIAAVIVVADPGGRDESTSAPTGAGGQESTDSGPSASSASAEESAGRSAEEVGGNAAPTLAQPPYAVPPAPRPGSPGSDGRSNRKVERSASLTLAARPRDIDAVSARIQDVTRRQGGFVVSSTVSSSPRGGGGTFELRVPARNLDATIASLARLGAVRERAQGSHDITAQAVSARSRLQDARTERRSLLRQLGEATTPAATRSIRERLELVSRELQQARAGLRRVNNRAAFSTVAVTLVADRRAGTPGTGQAGDWTPGDAARDALRVLELAAGLALIALAVALPLALLVAPAALAARWTRRRRREHALDVV